MWRATSSSEWGWGSVQHIAFQASAAQASALILILRVPSSPKTYIKRPKGVQESYKNLFLCHSLPRWLRNEKQGLSYALSSANSMFDSAFLVESRSGDWSGSYTACAMPSKEIHCQRIEARQITEEALCSWSYEDQCPPLLLADKSFFVILWRYCDHQSSRTIKISSKRDSILWMQPLGRENIEIHKFTIPVINVLMRRFLPENERDFVTQKLNLLLSLSIRGEYSDTFKLWCISGRPK